MDEHEWTTSADPAALLRCLRAAAPGEAPGGTVVSLRRLRLFAVGCSRTLGLPPAVESLGRGLAVVGRAVGATTSAFARAFAPALARAAIVGPVASLPAALREGALRYFDEAEQTDGEQSEWDPWNIAQLWCAAAGPQGSRVADVLRCVVGNPFRPTPINPSWLTWNGGTVPRLARTIRDELTFDRLPILADALEEAGCADAELLAHLRGPGPHVPGCRALEVLLGRE